MKQSKYDLSSYQVGEERTFSGNVKSAAAMASAFGKKHGMKFSVKRGPRDGSYSFTIKRLS